MEKGFFLYFSVKSGKKQGFLTGFIKNKSNFICCSAQKWVFCIKLVAQLYIVL